MQAGEYKLLVQLDMEELFSGKTVTPFRYIKPKGDILAQLRQWIDTDIETLYKIIAQQGRKAHNMYDYESVTRKRIHLEQHHDRTLRRLTFSSEKYTKEWNPCTYTCDKSAQELI